MKIKANRVADYDSAKNPGDYFIAQRCQAEPKRRLSFLCPCGCGSLYGISIRDDGQQIDGAWAWNKDEDKPTTTPSIMCYGPGMSSHWHGYLTNGEFASC